MKRLFTRMQQALLAVMLAMIITAPVAQAATEVFSSSHGSQLSSGWLATPFNETDDGIAGGY